MNKTTTIVAALGLGILSAFASGCGKSKALLAAEEYEKTACACKDTTCVTAATTKFSENAKDMATASGGEAEAIAKATTNGHRVHDQGDDGLHPGHAAEEVDTAILWGVLSAGQHLALSSLVLALSS